MANSSELGELPISKLLIKQSVPAAIGLLVLSIYMIVDTIFVGRYVGGLGIAAITVVLPITFFISALGMAIGVGGASVISRALGEDDFQKANLTFNNQISLMAIFVAVFLFIGYFFQDSLLKLFGANGEIMPFAKDYFIFLLPSTPFLAFGMMANNSMRAEGKPLFAMMGMLTPAIVNLILDPIFIIYFGWGIKGAAIATAISYVSCAGFLMTMFFTSKTELNFNLNQFKFVPSIIKEIMSLGSVTFARQGILSILAVIINNNLFTYGGELAVSAYGIVNRMMMFVFFPVFGIVQGFIPIAGFNFGAGKTERVKKSISTSIKYGTTIALLIYVVLMLFPDQLVSVFTKDKELIQLGSRALFIIFLATPFLTLQLIGSSYFQAIGKAVPALFLTLSRQGFFLIPLLIALPYIFGLDGIWYAFPISDVISTLVTIWFLRRSVNKTLQENPVNASIK